MLRTHDKGIIATKPDFDDAKQLTANTHIPKSTKNTPNFIDFNPRTFNIYQ